MVTPFEADLPRGLVIPAEPLAEPPNDEAYLPTRLTGGGNLPSQLGVTQDGALMALSTPGYGLVFWDPRDDTMIEGWDLRDVRSMALSPDGRWLALRRMADEVEVWDRPGRRPVLRLELPPDAPELELDFTPGGTGLWARRRRGELQLWCWDLEEVCFLLGRHLSEVREVVATPGPEGSLLAWSGEDGHLRVLDALQGNDLLEVRMASQDDEHRTAAIQGCFAPDGRRLVWGTNWYDLWDLDLRTQQVSHLHREHTDWLHGMTFDHDGRHLFTWSHTGRNLPGHSDLLVTDLERRGVVARLDIEDINGKVVRWAAGSERLGLLSERRVQLVDWRSDRVLRRFSRYWRELPGSRGYAPDLAALPRVPFDPARVVRPTATRAPRVLRVGKAPR